MIQTEAYTGFDVGGTTVTQGLVIDGQLIGEPSEYRSPSRLDTEEAIAAFTDMLLATHAQAGEHGLDVKAHGIAMPGPFDYRAGVSRMTHGKFTSIHGVDIKTPLESLGAPVYFVNDADAFALGVHSYEYPEEQRVLGITLGTGLGSGYVIEGNIVPPVSNEAPNGGEIWDLPFEGMELETAVFARGLLGTYAENGGNPEANVKDIMAQARNGESAAQRAVTVFAQKLGAGLALASLAFRPTRIVLGGRISESYDVFGDSMVAAFQEATAGSLEDVRFSCTKLATGHAAIYGAARYAAQQHSSLDI